MTGRRNSHSFSFLRPSFILGLTLVLSACSVGHYLSAYFNTYFNASKLFTEAETELLTAQTPASSPDTLYLPPYRVQGATKTKFASVIEKCSKILQYDSESSLVDDALLMIGKSYYYQNELQRAERKFGELITTYPESGLLDEAEVLLAETYYRMGEKEKARLAADEIADSTGGDRKEITARAFVLIGQLEYEQQNYAEARRAYRLAAEFGGESDERAGSFMKVAEMSIRLEDLDGALDAYRKAENQTSGYARQFRARMGQIDILTRQGEFADALELLDDIRANANFKEFFPEVDLTIANTLKSEGRISEAIQQYYLVDTTYQRTPSSARSHLALGTIYEKELRIYDSAMAVYTRGRSQSPQDAATPVMIRRGENLRQYTIYKAAITRLDSLKSVVLSTGSTVSPLPLTEGMPDSTADSLATAPSIPLPSIDSLNAGLAKNMADLGGLFYIGMGVDDSARYWYRRVLEEFPGSPYSPKALYSLAQIEESAGGRAGAADSIYRVIMTSYPFSPFATEARKILGYAPKEETEDPAVDLYAEAEMYLEEGSTGEAIGLFRRIVSEHPKSDIAPKAQFAIAWTFEQVEARPDSAVRNLKKLVHLFPLSTYASTAIAKLNNLTPQEVARIEKGPTHEDSTVVLPPDKPAPVPEPGDSVAVAEGDSSGVDE